MKRDNDEIIRICSDLSDFNRKSLIQLIEVGAPPIVLQSLLTVIEMAETIPQQLSETPIEERHLARNIQHEPLRGNCG